LDSHSGQKRAEWDGDSYESVGRDDPQIPDAGKAASSLTWCGLLHSVGCGASASATPSQPLRAAEAKGLPAWGGLGALKRKFGGHPKIAVTLAALRCPGP